MGKDRTSTSAEAATDTAGGHLMLQVSPRHIPIFFQLLGQGFTVHIHTGATVKDLLCKQLGIHENYLAQRIQTIFLNAKVVDDVNTAIVAEGSTLALSGAMPGLVGAILRSGGYYAAMRNQLSHTESKPASRVQAAKITLKLMNLVVKELGPQFLQQGVWLKSQTLKEFIERHTEDLRAGFIAGELDGQPVELQSLIGVDWSSDMVLLQVSSEALV